METITKKFEETVLDLGLPSEKVETYKKELVALIYFAYSTEVFEYYSEEEINEIKAFVGEDVEKLVEMFAHKQRHMNDLHPEITIESIGLPILEGYLKNVFNVQI